MKQNILFKALMLVMALSVLAALPVLAAPSRSAARQPLAQTPPDPQAVTAQPVFQAELSGANEVPAVPTDATGRAVFVLVDEAGTLTLYFKVLVEDIAGVTAAHIHEGAPGENGPVIFTLFDGTGTFDPDNPVTGSVTLTNAQLTELLAGNYYVNVHTSDYPDGEIRGQIALYTPPTNFHALLSGENEVPPVETEASGLASFTLNFGLDTLSYTVYVRDITGITEAHIYNGQPGEVGSIMFTLFDGTGTFDPDNPVSGDAPLTPQELLELLTGNLFVNVHTTEHTEGEIRGQINSGPVAFEALLSGANEVPRVATDASGRAVMVLENDLTTLHYNVAVWDMTGITAAHIHDGLPGENGPVLYPLYDGSGTFDEENPIRGTLTISETQAVDLAAGNFYVNVHTEANPDGEIRGQLQVLENRDFNALLLGEAEVPEVNTDASGVARFTLADAMDRLDYELAVSDIADITAAHLHPGYPGEENPPVITLFSGDDPRAFDPDNPISGHASLDAQDLLDLLSGRLYVNVHTGSYPDGEIRGQAGSGFHAFEATLSGAEEVPPVSTEASGRAVTVLDNDLSTLYYRVTVADIDDITAAHIHEAPPGEPGPVVFPLFDGTGEFSPTEPISGTLALDITQAATLVAGDYYVNVHTSLYPDGEIRGQLELFAAPRSFSAALTGENEVPPVDTEASGQARLELNETQDVLHYYLSVQDITGITAAHIHTRPAGENGPVRFPLFDGTGDFGPDDPIGGDVILGPQDLLDLLTGFLYVNVHTTENPGGEIRGQIKALRFLYFPLVLNNFSAE